MTDIEVNKRVHEIMGLCFHEDDEQHTYNVVCRKCLKVFSPFKRLNLNFIADWQTSAYAFGLMWEFMQKHERFWGFCNQYGDVCNSRTWLPTKLISPRAFAMAMCEFFKEAKTEGG